LKEKLLSWLLLAFFLLLGGTAGAADRQPLSEHDLLMLLAGGVHSSRVAALVEDRGISFVPTRTFLEAVHKAGGQQPLEHALLVAPQTISKVGPNRAQSPIILHVTPLKSPLPGVSNHVPSMVAQPSTHSELVAKPTIGIPPGTLINIDNWNRYQQFMPLSMINLFKGNLFWKMPPDIEIAVGPTTTIDLPRSYSEATTKYAENVKVLRLPDGHYDIENYKGGVPFPSPQEPDKGYKLLADLWFSYIPHIVAGTDEIPLSTCSQTSNGYVNCVRLSYVFRQLAYNTDKDVVPDETNGQGPWYTEWMAVQEPEQLRYTTMLTLYPRNNQQAKEQFMFLPSLRRWIRRPLEARCTPVTGTDYVEDDYKREGFNGGIGAFGAQFLGHQQILALTGDYAPLGGDFPRNYYMPLGWPKPSWGKWQLRDVDVIDVRPIAAEQSTYCYGKRIIYEDSSTHYALWEDAYDTNMRLWKTSLLAQRIIKDAVLGVVPAGFNSSAWDWKKHHMTNTSTENRHGEDFLSDSAVPKEFQSLNSYSTPAGLAEIMQ
jgi:Protein of unknown function (DUF1329)